MPYIVTNDGTQTLFSTLQKYIPDVFLILWRYGIDAFRLKFWLSRKLSHFVRLVFVFDQKKSNRIL